MLKWLKGRGKQWARLCEEGIATYIERENSRSGLKQRKNRNSIAGLTQREEEGLFMFSQKIDYLFRFPAFNFVACFVSQW